LYLAVRFPTAYRAASVLRLSLLTAALGVLVLAYATWLRRRAAARLDVGAVSQRWLLTHAAEER
jgi:hypothetical protein